MSYLDLMICTQGERVTGSWQILRLTDISLQLNEASYVALISPPHSPRFFPLQNLQKKINNNTMRVGKKEDANNLLLSLTTQ